MAKKDAGLFDGIEVAFAADCDPVVHHFKMFGQGCFVSIKPMDGSAYARYERKLYSSAVQSEKGEETQTKYDLDIDSLELDLLMGSVADFALARKKKAHDGNPDTPPIEVVEMTLGSSLNPAQTRAVFESLDKTFRKRLVKACCEVNGLSFFA